MSQKTKVKFLKPWRYAHGGCHVQSFEVDSVHDLHEACLKNAIEDGVVELVTDEKTPEKRPKKASKPAAEASEKPPESASLAL